MRVPLGSPSTAAYRFQCRSFYSPARSIAITRKAFLISLTLLGIASLWLAGLIGHWGSPRAPSIGGGSYSLDRFVYSGLIILLTATWALGALIVAWVRNDAALSRRAYILSLVGFVAFAGACWFYGSNLD
ncbi:hypothetical protein ACSBM8_14250 [Sphingomonas sp. ASY06-1R]|uniref:hypothetical protein n=1 Tax=Sphingomonas sp. ASY06-1R TaxID=3445771 RepID=UPI003FA265A4